MAPTYTSWGNQPSWGGARPESPPSESQAALMLKGKPLGAVLSAGLRPSLKTLIRPNGGGGSLTQLKSLS